MAIRKSFSWPSPVHEERTSVLVLTEECLCFARALETETAEQVLAGAVSEFEALELPLANIASVSFIPKRMDLRVMDTAGKGWWIGPLMEAEVAEEILRAVAQARSMEVRREIATTKELLRSPLLTGAVVLLVGIYLAILAGTEPAEDTGFFAAIADLARGLGGGAIWPLLLLGLGACLYWAWRVVQDPWEVLIARARGRETRQGEPKVDEAVLREATARLLGIAGESLTEETNFCDELRIPPGELFERLTDLEEELQTEIADKKSVRTYGQLRTRL